jgi:hypothetical protein
LSFSGRCFDQVLLAGEQRYPVFRVKIATFAALEALIASPSFLKRSQTDDFVQGDGSDATKRYCSALQAEAWDIVIGFYFLHVNASKTDVLAGEHHDGKRELINLIIKSLRPP